MVSPLFFCSVVPPVLCLPLSLSLPSQERWPCSSVGMAFLVICRKRRPRAAHPRPHIGRASQSPPLTSEVSAHPVTVITSLNHGRSEHAPVPPTSVLLLLCVLLNVTARGAPERARQTFLFLKSDSFFFNYFRVRPGCAITEHRRAIYVINRARAYTRHARHRTTQTVLSSFSIKQTADKVVVK